MSRHPHSGSRVAPQKQLSVERGTSSLGMLQETPFVSRWDSGRPGRAGSSAVVPSLAEHPGSSFRSEELQDTESDENRPHGFISMSSLHTSLPP